MPRRATIRCLVTLAVCSTLSAARAGTTPPSGQASAAAPKAPPSAPCSAPEFHQFDFWVGDWEVTTPDGKPAGTNLVTRPLGDCVVQEHWKGQGGMSGESYNMFDSAGGHWHQTWVSDRGAYLALEGGRQGADMVLEGQPWKAAGQMVIDRITWQPKSPDEVHQIWQQSIDQGKSWTIQFYGVYKRRR